MIGALISGLFNFILGLLSTIIQIVVLPVNLLISNALPDLSQGLTAVGSGLTTFFGLFDWVLSLIPTPLLWVFAFCFTIRVLVVSISISTHALIKVWNILQKIKFW